MRFDARATPAPADLLPTEKQSESRALRIVERFRTGVRRSRGLAILAGLALSAGPICGSVLADDPSYTIEDVKACSRDALRLCRDKLGHLDEIEACMRAHYAQLSTKCQARFR